ncbi:MAG: methyltransferase domain-containing protein [Nitrospirae bacterium]|nr:methyltransferase domain-containing protein [Nitrospirota bacterium]
MMRSKVERGPLDEQRISGPDPDGSAVRNLSYGTDRIAEYYATHRRRWDDFYPSERWVLERVGGGGGTFGNVLDVGCAAGGLALALAEKYPVSSYVGVDINGPAIEEARRRASEYSMPVSFVCGDVLRLGNLPRSSFDTVFSLSCADWNLETDRIIHRCWQHVSNEGVLILSMRLTERRGTNDFSKSFQWIRFDGIQGEVERANYVVFNVRGALALLSKLRPRPRRLLTYGYWGTPSPTAVTPYERLVFAVFALWKTAAGTAETETEIHLPLSVWLEPEAGIPE